MTSLVNLLILGLYYVVTQPQNPPLSPQNNDTDSQPTSHPFPVTRANWPFHITILCKQYKLWNVSFRS